MPIELPKEARQQAITSIERYFREHMDEPIGNVAAGGLLNFFLQEIGPSVYNRAVSDAQSPTPAGREAAPVAPESTTAPD